MVPYASGYPTEVHVIEPHAGESSIYNSVPHYSHEASPATPSSTATPPTTAPKVEAKVEADSAILTVSVPEDAVVTVNGHPTKSLGTIRQFMSTGLEEGYVYKYVVEVKYSGVETPEKRTVRLKAGSTERLVFAGPRAESIVTTKATDVETVVTLRVPKDAKVTLAGNETHGAGEIRTFRTRRLGNGDSWSGYTIRVTANINGSEISKEKTLDLVAGANHDLAFDFNASDVAQR